MHSYSYYAGRARYKNGNKHKVYPDNFAFAPLYILGQKTFLL